MCERYIGENIEVAEPAETGQLLVLMVLSVIRHLREAVYWVGGIGVESHGSLQIVRLVR